MLPTRSGIAVNYGGIRVGDIGGPLVKVSRLQEYFPEVGFGFSLVYLLSNAPYLPGVALDLLKFRRIPIVYNQNGVFYKAWFSGDWRKENRRMARAYHAADWVFYQSKFCLHAAEQFLGVRKGSGEVLYNAVDTHRFSPSSKLQRYDGGEFQFLVTGNIGFHQIYRLKTSIAGLKVARELGLDARLVVAGAVESRAEASARELARSLGVIEYVVFDGPYTQSSAPDVYRRAHAYMMTNHNDACPNSVLEALATGLPVVYSNSGGVPELVGTNAGIPLDTGESWEYVRVPEAGPVGRAMVEVAEKYSHYTTSARSRAVSQFDIGHWIARHRQVFENLIGNR